MGNIRRSRGYAFEHGLVEKLNKTPNWGARRLGGSSTGLPDIVATNNVTGTLLAIECKSTVSNAVYIPPDQVQRCVEVCKMFGYYKERHVIFAVKFGRTRNRQLKYYFKRADLVLLPEGLAFPTYKITYDGRVYEIANDGSGIKDLADYILDFSLLRHLSSK